MGVGRGVLIALLAATSLFAAEEEVSKVDFVIAQEISNDLVVAAPNSGPDTQGFISAGDFGPEGDDYIDPRVLRDFIESRGLIRCRQKEGALTIAGDVRARWNVVGEKADGAKQRGTGTNVAVNQFKSEVNLFLDYAAPRTWVSTKLKWVNYDGKDGGTATKTEMDRAFIGFDFHNVKETDAYIEIGRSKLDYIFESRVEFTSTFDGIHLFYTTPWPSVGVFTIHGGPFIIDSTTNHYGWAVETFVSKWMATGMNFKYSIIDWHRHSPTKNYGNLSESGTFTVVDNPRYRFIVSQMLFGYERKLPWVHCKTLYAYAAVLANHDAKRTKATNWEKLNGAWYIGFTLGKLCKAGDWSIDLNYQSVGAQAVPEFDLAGMGHGNAANLLLSDAILLGLGANGAIGFTNYKGWEASALFAVSDSLSLRARAARTVPRNQSVGNNFRYKTFDMTVIYAF